MGKRTKRSATNIDMVEAFPAPAETAPATVEAPAPEPETATVTDIEVVKAERAKGPNTGATMTVFGFPLTKVTPGYGVYSHGERGDDWIVTIYRRRSVTYGPNGEEILTQPPGLLPVMLPVTGDAGAEAA